MTDLYSALGYLSGLYLISPDIEAFTLLRTVILIHLLDAVMCRLIADHSDRNKNIWTFAGLIFGIWALGPLFLLAGKGKKES
jgi:hypothetical protein